MKNVNSFIRIFFCIHLFFAFPNIAAAQVISEKLCESVFASVDSLLNPTKTYRREVYDSDCDFEFRSGEGEGISLTLEKHRTGKESRKAYKEQLTGGFWFCKKYVSHPFSSKYWDDAALYWSGRPFDNFMVLRKEVFLVTIFTYDPQTFVKLEKLLRDVDFEGLDKLASPG